MNPVLLQQICTQIYHRFPEVSGVLPRQQTANKNTILIFEAQVSLPQQISIPHIIRVTVHQTGKILKISTSR